MSISFVARVRQLLAILAWKAEWVERLQVANQVRLHFTLTRISKA